VHIVLGKHGSSVSNTLKLNDVLKGGVRQVGSEEKKIRKNRNKKNFRKGSTIHGKRYAKEPQGGGEGLASLLLIEHQK